MATLHLDELLAAFAAGPHRLREVLRPGSFEDPVSSAASRTIHGDASATPRLVDALEAAAPHPVNAALAACALVEADLTESWRDRCLAQIRRCQPAQPSPLFSALLGFADAASLAGGLQYERWSDAVQRAILLVPDGCGRREAALTQLAMRLAMHGRLYSLAGPFGLPPPNSPSEAWDDALVLPGFIDAIERGQPSVAEMLRPRLGAAGGQILDRYLLLHDRLTSVLVADGRSIHGAASCEDIAVDHVMALAGSDLDLASLMAARLDGSEHLDPIGFCSWLPVRLALALGDAPAARTAVAVRHRLGCQHPLGAFFLARTELLEGRVHEAARHFALARDGIGAEGAERLEIELRLAPELPRLGIVQLMGAHTPPSIQARSGPLAGAMQQAAQIGEEDDSSPIAGHSAAMAEVRNRIRSGPGPIPRNGGLPCLTIMGPPSSGRRTMAAALLASWWPAPMPHVWFDATACEHDAAIAGLTESLARAAGGVLVVIGPEHLPPAAQALLGQACAPLLGSSEPDRDRRTNLVFVMAADPRQASSLHHRLRQHLTARCVGIPPLRDRPEDIAPILRRILRHRWNRRIDLTPDALLTLAAHPWPGGTAELSVVADRLIELPEGVAVGSYQISSALVA